jgi:hypothetical protein
MHLEGFSTTTGCGQVTPMYLAVIRASTFVPPPGTKGTTMLMPRLG